MSDKTTEPAYTTRSLNADTWGDFAKLVEANIADSESYPLWRSESGLQNLNPFDLPITAN